MGLWNTLLLRCIMHIIFFLPYSYFIIWKPHSLGFESCLIKDSCKCCMLLDKYPFSFLYLALNYTSSSSRAETRWRQMERWGYSFTVAQYHLTDHFVSCQPGMGVACCCPCGGNAASLANPALPVTPMSHLCLCPFLCRAKNRHQPQVVSALYWFWHTTLALRA